MSLSNVIVLIIAIIYFSVNSYFIGQMEGADEQDGIEPINTSQRALLWLIIYVFGIIIISIAFIIGILRKK